jgi:hypothetical protein
MQTLERGQAHGGEYGVEKPQAPRKFGLQVLPQFHSDLVGRGMKQGEEQGPIVGTTGRAQGFPGHSRRERVLMRQATEDVKILLTTGRHDPGTRATLAAAPRGSLTNRSRARFPGSGLKGVKGMKRAFATTHHGRHLLGGVLSFHPPNLPVGEIIFCPAPRSLFAEIGVCSLQNMSDSHLLTAIEAFLADPAPSAVRRVLECSEWFIVNQARRWAASGMVFADRCRELLAEMFLILVEQVTPGRVTHPKGVLAYVALRLRRLTRPGRARECPFGLAGDLDGVGRSGFTPSRLALVEALVSAVRQVLATDPHRETRRLETLFLHVRPELAWASRHLAAGTVTDPQQRYEADKKRHQGFCRTLRTAFEEIPHGDWQEVQEWSAGERSHLAWSIISLADWELHGLAADDLQALADWRDRDRVPGDAAAVGLSLIDRLVDHLAKVHLTSRLARSGVTAPLVQETAAPYGEPDPEEWFERFLRPVLVETGTVVAEEDPSWEDTEGAKALAPNAEEQKVFRHVCLDLTSWAEAMCESRLRGVDSYQIPSRSCFEPSEQPAGRPSTSPTSSPRPHLRSRKSPS